MNNFKKLATTMVIAITLLAACAQPTEQGAERTTICHATGSETNPYEEITISGNGMQGHDGHPDDIIPAPAEGCPGTNMTGTPGVDTTMTTTLTTDTPDVGSPTASTPITGTTSTPGIPVTGGLTVCHATGNTTTPYEDMAVADEEELNEHRAHANDINPAPLTGCPTYPIIVTDGTVPFCHTEDGVTFEEVIVMIDGLMSIDGLEDHSDHPNDAFPVSEGAGCP